MPRKGNDVRLSKFISKVLRHQPECIGLKVDSAGWASVLELLEKSQAAGMNLTAETLERLVRSSDKRRFCFNEDRSRIRANQGHSLSVELGLCRAQPPDTLYHGTSTKSVGSIRAQGIRKMQRHHVHLSANIPTAIAVGRRHGKEVVLAVNAKAMRDAGIAFFLSANGVWLVDEVAPQFFDRLEQ